MKIWIGLLCALLTIACASKRERRQSVYASEQTTMHLQRDTTWFQQQWEGYTAHVVEIEEWNRYTLPSVTSTVSPDSNTFGSGGLTPSNGAYNLDTGRFTQSTGSNYRRTRSISWSKESNTVTSSGSTRSDSSYTGSTKSNTFTSTRNTSSPIGKIGRTLLILALLVLLYLLLRKVNR